MIRVLIVDDSAFIRKALADIFKKDPEIEVIGEARDGEEAIRKIYELKPDVVTLDYEMPKKNGIEVIREVMKNRPTPIVMISSYTKEGSRITLKALEEGAVDFISKDIEKSVLEVIRKEDEIIMKVKSAAGAKIKRETLPQQRIQKKDESIEKVEKVVPARMKKVLIIGASTGGPQAVVELLSHIDFYNEVGIVVVIHMPPMFTETYAQRLEERTGIPSKEAKDGDAISAGKILVAPGGVHIAIKRGGIINIVKDYPSIYRPSIDLAMRTAAEVFGKNVIGVVLTGMGSDGTEGLREIKKWGGVGIAESEKTAVIFGMPKSAIQAGVADFIADLHSIPQIIKRLI